MIPLDKHDLTMLHVLSSEKLMLKSLKAAKAGQELFPPRRVPHLDLLWRHFIRFAIQSKKEGHWLQWDRQAYVADCLEELKQRDDISDECKARFQAICVQYIGAEPLDSEAGDKLLMEAVNEAIRAQISRAVYNSEAFDGIRQLVNKGVELKESLETADEKQKLFVNPLLEVETYLHVLPKMPTGVRYFDRVTNGGMSEGEVALIAGLMGGGKCLGKDTPVLMYDGTVKKVQDVRVGDQLIGMDSTPRTVLSLGRGRSEMYKVTPVKGDSFTVNRYHILTMICSGPVLWKGVRYKPGDLIDICVEDLYAQSDSFKSLLKVVRTGVDFKFKSAPELDPYFVGLYLGDGAKGKAQITTADTEVVGYCVKYMQGLGFNCNIHKDPRHNCIYVNISKVSNKTEGALTIIRRNTFIDDEKRILDMYKTGSREVRMKILAGLIDSDGYTHHGFHEIVTKYSSLADDICFVARSLGYAAYVKKCEKTCYNTGAAGTYYKVSISGDFSDLPVLLPRHKLSKRKQVKSVLRTGYTITKLPEDEYYGFTIDGDHRFLLGDFTITHNTATAIQLVGSQLLVGNPVAWFTFEQPFDQDLMQRMVSFITGYSLDIIRGREFKDLPEDIRTKFLALSNQMSDKLIAADFSNNNMLDKNDPEDDGSVYSLCKRLDIWADQGKVPTYIMFDWVGAAVKRLAAVRSIDIGQITNYIALANEIIDGLVQLAKQYHTRVIFFHQLDPAIKKSPPSRKPTTVELQMMKTMSNYTQYAMAIGKRDENQRCWFVCDKCRNSYPSECVIELDGAHAKFNLLEGYAPGRNGQFININELQEELNDSSDTADSYQPVI